MLQWPSAVGFEDQNWHGLYKSDRPSRTTALLMCSHNCSMDSLGIGPRTSRMLSGCDTTTPQALEHIGRTEAPMVVVGCAEATAQPLEHASRPRTGGWWDRVRFWDEERRGGQRARAWLGGDRIC